MKIVVIFLFATLLTSSVTAQDLLSNECRPWDQMALHLKQVGQIRHLVGVLEGGDEGFTLYHNPTTGRWTGLTLRLEGKERFACADFKGTGLRIVSKRIIQF